MVQIKQSDGNIGEPQPLQALLRSLDLKTHVVIQLTRPGERIAAVVDVREKLDLLKQVREQEILAKKQAAAAKVQKPKQMELNWAIDAHDFEMKLKQMEQFLEKGRKVEILLAPKKRQRRATPEEANGTLKKLLQKVDDIGAREVKAMTGEVMKQAIITVQKKAA